MGSMSVRLCFIVEKRHTASVWPPPHLSQYSQILLKLQKFSHPSHFYLKPETPYAKIGKNTIIGAGSLVTQGKEFPEGVLILGNPAKVIRQLTEAEIESIQRSADNYVSLSKKYKK